MTNETQSILFVCTGNICRSPVAQFLAARFAREAGLPWKTASAGVEAEIGHGMTPGALRALASRGIKGVGHLARQLDEQMMDEADKIYALTHAHRQTMIGRFPRHASKIFILREAANLRDIDVEDPYGMSDAVYEECAARIEQALKILIRRSSHAENPR